LVILISSLVGSPGCILRGPGDLVLSARLGGVAPHVIGQQLFIVGGERGRNALPKCITVAGHEVDSKSCSQSEEVTPSVAVTFGELIDQLLDAGSGLGDHLFLFSLPQCHLSAKRTFEQIFEIGCN
jgi:hypothetical protein